MSIQAPSLFETNTATPPTGYDGVGRGSLGGGSSRNQTFITDYTVRAITDVVLFRVSRSLYQAARSATLLERAQRDINDTNNELDRVLNSANKEEAESVIKDNVDNVDNVNAE